MLAFPLHSWVRSATSVWPETGGVLSCSLKLFFRTRGTSVSGALPRVGGVWGLVLSLPRGSASSLGFCTDIQGLNKPSTSRSEKWFSSSGAWNAWCWCLWLPGCTRAEMSLSPVQWVLQISPVGRRLSSDLEATFFFTDSTTVCMRMRGLSPRKGNLELVTS